MSDWNFFFCSTRSVLSSHRCRCRRLFCHWEEKVAMREYKKRWFERVEKSTGCLKNKSYNVEYWSSLSHILYYHWQQHRPDSCIVSLYIYSSQSLWIPHSIYMFKSERYCLYTFFFSNNEQCVRNRLKLKPLNITWW